MSSETYSTYYVAVDRNELLRQARLAAARSAANEARWRADAAIGRFRAAQALLAFGTIPVADLPVVEEASAEGLERFATRADAFVRDLDAAIGRAKAVDRLHSIASASRDGGGPIGDWSEELRARSAARPGVASKAGDPEMQRTRRQEMAARIVGRLGCALGVKEQREFDALCAEIIGCTDTARGESLATELRLRVQRANDRAERVSADAAAAAGLAQRLSGLDGEDVVRLRAELRSVSDGVSRLPRDLAERVERTKSKAEKRADDAYVNLVLREELSRLGYDVGPEFATLFTAGGEAIVRRREQSEYGVEVGVDAERGTFELSVVRLGECAEPPTADRAFKDKSAEERWCRDDENLTAAMQARGVKRRTIRLLPPGAGAVRVPRSKRAAGSRRIRREDALHRES
jgi:hypothetical protein